MSFEMCGLSKCLVIQTLTALWKEFTLPLLQKSLLITVCLRSCDICVTELQVYCMFEMFWKDFCVCVCVRACVRV